jgi:hypothetical protein
MYRLDWWKNKLLLLLLLLLLKSYGSTTLALRIYLNDDKGAVILLSCHKACDCQILKLCQRTYVISTPQIEVFHDILHWFFF